MENQKGNTSLKAIILVLSLLLLGSLFYIFKLTTETKTLETEVSTVKTDKDKALKDLEAVSYTHLDVYKRQI